MQTKERLVGTLSRPNRPLESWLAALGIDGANITETVAWSNRLQTEVQRWSVNREVLTDGRRIDKREADRRLRIGLFGSAVLK